jgi:FKBP-type peptidyl-prolyl cis-trans isomerase FkpA
MRKNLLIMAVAALGLASCKGGFKQADGGLLYNIRVDKSGPTVKVGDFISLNLILKTEGDSVLGSTYELGRPVPQLMQKEQHKGDISTGIMLLSEGDSATIKLSIDSMFKKGAPRPPGIKGKYLVYEIKVEKVIPKGNLSDVVFQGRISEYFKQQADAIKKLEPAKIKKFVEDKKLKTTTTTSGLQYVITKPGVGANAAPGDTAVVNYTGKLLTGKFFDSSIKEEALKSKLPMDPRRTYEPIKVVIGEGKVIKGWEEGLTLLNKGAKATLVIPSELGWGEQGYPPAITPFTPVTFEVEMVNIIHGNPNAPKTIAPQPPVR